MTNNLDPGRRSWHIWKMIIHTQSKKKKKFETFIFKYETNFRKIHYILQHCSDQPQGMHMQIDLH